MITYLKRNVPGQFVTLDTQLDPQLYDNIGLSYEDYLNNKWIQLSENQLQFHNNNPTASAKEIIEMQLEQNVTDIRAELLRELEQYNVSNNVDAFIVNGNKAWFTVQERLNYKQSIESAKLLGIDTLEFYIGDSIYSISTTMAEYMLAQIQLYADKCYMVTKQHRLNILNLENLDNYDYTAYYPEMLNFEL